MSNISKIKLPSGSDVYDICDASALRKVGTFGGNDAGTYSYTLPQSGLYLIFFHKINTSSDGLLGVYLANATTSNGGRVAIKTIAPLDTGINVTIAIVNSQFVVTIDTNGQTYMRGHVYFVGA